MTLLLLLSLRGTAFIYQGEELGLPQADVPFDRLVDPEAIANWPKTLGRDGARTPMPWRDQAPWGGFSTVEPWLPVDARHLPLSVASQTADPDSTLALTRRLIALRRSRPALQTGAHRTIADAPDGLIVFERGAGEDRLLCVFNPTRAAIVWTSGPGWTRIESRQ